MKPEHRISVYAIHLNIIKLGLKKCYFIQLVKFIPTREKGRRTLKYRKIWDNLMYKDLQQVTKQLEMDPV